MKAFWHILAMACVIVTLTIAGLAGFLLASGRITPETRAMAIKVLRGEPLTPPAAEDEPSGGYRQAVSEEESLSMSERAAARTNLLTSRQLAELEYKQRQLENLQKQVMDQNAELQRLRDELAAERETLAQDLREGRKNDGESFKRELKLYEQMDPKQVRDIFMNLDEKLAADFMAAMKPQTLADIMASFKTEEEKAKARKLLAAMRDI